MKNDADYVFYVLIIWAIIIPIVALMYTLFIPLKAPTLPALALAVELILVISAAIAHKISMGGLSSEKEEEQQKDQ